MKRLSLSIAAVGFFLLAGVGTACEQEPLTCAVRAAAGAGALYVVTRFAGRLAVRIVVDAVLRSTARAPKAKDQP